MELSREQLLDAYRYMRLIREFEERSILSSPQEKSPASFIFTPVKRPLLWLSA
jgi:TPP-dependent pyruvate/acetoin dehydrogenase alpha subunit